MARKKFQKEKITDPLERIRLKKLRSAQRREERKQRKKSAGDSDEPRARRQTAPDYAEPMVKDDYLWIRRDRAKAYATKILNDARERPYWLSIPHAMGDGPLPISHFYPCSVFRTADRVYFGFLFREHRDLFFDTLPVARKEFTDAIKFRSR